MPRKKQTYRLLSLINSTTLLLQQILFPFWFIFSPTPAFAESPKIFSFDFAKSSNSFTVHVPSTATVSYGLYYVYDDNVTEAVSGSFVEDKDIKAGTCSEGGACVTHTVKRGVFKYQSETHTGGISFVVVNDKLEIISEYEIEATSLTPEEEAWLNGTDNSPPYSKVSYPDPTPTPEPAPMNVMLTAAQTTPITVDSNKCMADLYGSKLNCTANDVSIASVSNIQVLDSCDYPGDNLTFTATWDVKSTATERYNVGLYFASGGQTSALNGSCSISSLPNSPVPPWYDFDQNICGDISSAAMVHPEITMTVKCLDPDGDNILNLPYCTSWEQNSSACSGPLNTIPGSPSKCNCDDGFEVPITVPHSAQIEVVKNLVPDSDSGRFNLQIDGVDKAINVGDGSTGKVVVSAGTSQVPGAIHTVSETAYGSTDLSLYNSSISCIDRGKTTFDGGPALYQTGIGPINVDVDKDDDIVCTITNSTKIGSLVVQKTTLPSGDQTVFTINATGSGTISGSTAGTVSDTQDYSYEVTTGTYSITETVPTGWTKTGDTCQNVVVGAGQTVYCQLTNTKQATLTLNKTVVNDNGGTATAANFQAKIDDSNVAWGTPVVVSAGTHTSSETNLTGYQASVWSGDCTAKGSVTLAPGENKTCTITNDDIAPSLTLIKTVDNNNGGTATASAWTLTASGPTSISGAGGATSDSTFKAGSYTLSESGPTGYTAGSWNCTGVTNIGNSISLGLGQSATCTINNDDQAATLIVKKVVINDNGGTLEADDFEFKVNNGTAVPFESDGQNNLTVNAGTYSVVEPTVTGYATTYDNCSDLVIPNGGTATCTITNNDKPATLIVKKVVTNDDGGTKVANDFKFQVNGGSAETFEADGQNDMTVNAGTYTVIEPGVTGYSTTYDNCTDVVIPNGGSATCTITNNDIAPKLKLVKQVVNDNGGDASASAWTLTATGEGGFSDNGYTGGFHAVKANVSYDLTESSLPGYSSSWWSCDGGQASGNTVKLALAEEVTCTITNDDIAPKLTVIKTVTNNNGGNNVVADFKLYVDGVQVTSGVKNSYVSNHLYTLTEDNLTGYSASSWGGDCAANGTITLKPGDDKTCTITNDDIAPAITLIKQITGGKTDVNSFGLSIGGISVNSGVKTQVMANQPVVLNEAGLTGWSFVSITGDAKCPTVLGGSATLTEGEEITCTITNNRDTGSLMVHKIIDEDGDLLTIDDQTPGVDWEFTVGGSMSESTNASGSAVFSDLVTGDYDVEETNQLGYDQIGSSCDGEVTVAKNQTAECTFYNTPNGEIHGYKWDDVNGDRDDFGEVKLAGWTINLYRMNNQEDYELIKSMVTDDSETHYGWYWFEHLFPGEYKVCEVLQAGWAQTFPNTEGEQCHYFSMPLNNVFNFRFSQNAIYAPEYNFGNQYVQPRLTIEKYNNRWPNTLSPNDEVSYTIVITAHDNVVYNVRVSDLLPKDIVYQGGSYQALSSLHGQLNIAPPTYASPGTWTLGTMAKGEVITLTYKGKLNSDIDAGTYKDIAWAAGTVDSEPESSLVIAASVPTDKNIDPGNIAETFVGTKILVDRSPSADVNVIEEKQQGKVLGATTLPATGANVIWVLISAGLIGTGTGLWLAGGKRKNRHA